MKANSLILLALMLPLVGCSTVDQAKKDFKNFKATVQYNAKVKHFPVVVFRD